MKSSNPNTEIDGSVLGDDATLRSCPDWPALAGSRASVDSLTALAGADPAELSGSELVEAVVASEKAMSMLAAIQMRLLSAFAKPFVAGDPMRLAARLARKNCITGDEDPNNVEMFVPEAAASLAAAEVAAALRISPVTAGIRVREAETMTTELAPTLDLLHNGTLDRGKARIIAEHCAPLTPDHKAELQELVLPHGGTSTSSELRELAAQAVIVIDPDGADERHKAAAARRDIALSALPDAMATLRAFLPADGAVKIFQVSDLLATGTAGTPGDTRGIGARRIDALVDIADQLLTHGYLDLGNYLGRPLPDHGLQDTASRPGRAEDAPAGDGDPIATVDTAATSDLGPADDRAATSDLGPADDRAATSDLGQADDRAATSDFRQADDSTDPEDPGATDPEPGDDDRLPDGYAHDLRDVAPPVGGVSRRDPNEFAVLACGCGRQQRGRDVVGHAFRRQGRAPHLSVTIGLDTLAGRDDLPRLLAGFGAIPAGMARSIAVSASTVTALITDPATGRAVDAGSLTYRPRQELRDQVAALLNYCQFPSCRQPAWRCDVDHRTAFDHQNAAAGGPTSRHNAGPLCRRHHLFKHHSEWRIRLDPDRVTVHWASPTGHHYSSGSRQAAPPGIWVTSAGTLLAERLDNVTATGDASDPVSKAEDLLAALLLRHQLDTRPIEYVPVPEFWEEITPDAADGLTESLHSELGADHSESDVRADPDAGALHSDPDPDEAEETEEDGSAVSKKELPKNEEPPPPF